MQTACGTLLYRLLHELHLICMIAARVLLFWLPGPLPASSLCQGNTLPTLFPNVNWQECLTQTFQENATCLGTGISGTSCENIEQTAECQTDGTWGLVYGGCRGVSAVDQHALAWCATMHLDACTVPVDLLPACAFFFWVQHGPVC